MLEKIPETVGAVVLAAGRGRRLGLPDTPKVMALIGGKPIVEFILGTLQAAGFTRNRICLVVGFMKDRMLQYFGNSVSYAVQDEQKGTAHAAWYGARAMPEEVDTILILGGDDSAFYIPITLKNFVQAHQVSGAAISVLTTIMPHPEQLGRILRGPDGVVQRIIEKEELPEHQRSITEVSTGTFVVNRQWFMEIFPALGPIGGLGEYGLPSLIELAHRSGKKVQAVQLANPEEWFGVNTPEELTEADALKMLQKHHKFNRTNV